jgi:hypothetical protein
MNFPAYPVVEACKQLGFRSPWDVRWLPLSRLRKRAERPGGLFRIRRWLERFSLGRRAERICSCGQPVPVRRYYCIAPLLGLWGYLFGQCPGCRTIYWEEVAEKPGRK